MTLSRIDIPGAAGMRITTGGRPRSPELDRELLDRLLSAAGASRPRLERRRVLEAWSQIERVEPSDVALAEHLESGLGEQELRVIELRVTRMVPRKLAAQALGISEDELAQLEDSACVKATELSLAFHEEMICEPAALAEADTPEARRSAVREHVASCRSCRAEFAARVALVLRHAGSLAPPGTPAPGIALAGRKLG